MRRKISEGKASELKLLNSKSKKRLSKEKLTAR
jgi:hypothetical protein